MKNPKAKDDSIDDIEDFLNKLDSLKKKLLKNLNKFAWKDFRDRIKDRIK